ncbi:MAG: DMT family transporter [Oscillospiraceae bacterium]|nr:DMT family transporter [Oscillospiraceae bacterium]
MKTASQAKTTPYLAAGTAIFFWASSYAGVRYALHYYSPEALMLFRFLIASSVLLGYCALKKIPPPKMRDFPFFLAAGFLGLFVYMWFFTTGTATVPAGLSSFIISSAPIYTLVFSILFLKEKATFQIWLGVLISFAGLAIISFSQSGALQLNSGILFLLIAAVLLSMYSIIQKRIVRNYSAIQSTAYCVGIATVCMLIFAPALVREFPDTPMSGNLAVIWLGLGPAASAYFLWALALSRVEKTIHVTSFSYLTPFLASIIAFVWLGEDMAPLTLLGGVIIVTGMILTNFKQIKHMLREERTKPE